jgi:hypothetical protein
LAHGPDLANQGLRLGPHAKADEEIHRLFPDAGIDKLLPIHDARKQIAQAAGRLLLDFVDPNHAFTCTGIFSSC